MTVNNSTMIKTKNLSAFSQKYTITILDKSATILLNLVQIRILVKKVASKYILKIQRRFTLRSDDTLIENFGQKIKKMFLET